MLGFHAVSVPFATNSRAPQPRARKHVERAKRLPANAKCLPSASCFQSRPSGIGLSCQGFSFFPSPALRVEEAETKPIIAKRDEGKDNTIKNGEIYYRYGGRTQKILSAELERIIDRRVERNNSQWLDLMSKIAQAGPANAAILDTQQSLIQMISL